MGFHDMSTLIIDHTGLSFGYLDSLLNVLETEDKNSVELCQLIAEKIAFGYFTDLKKNKRVTALTKADRHEICTVSEFDWIYH